VWRDDLRVALTGQRLREASVAESETESTTADAMDDESVDKEIERVEEDPPKNLEDWPGGKAKYKTFGGPEGRSGYGEDVTEKLGPSDLVHEPDGSVTIKGEKVDNPEDYKGDPIPGGPTDPEAPPDPGFDEDAEHSGDDDS
jgi:hypothetical protein